MAAVTFVALLCLGQPSLSFGAASQEGPLAAELHEKGWIAFSAQTAQGDWDLFLMRPDGSARRAITQTAQFNEAGARFSPDGKKLLYYRMASTDAVDNNTYGTFDLVIADSRGGSAVVYGRGFPWATWGPDGRQLACLLPGGIKIVDVATRETVRTLPRQGIVEQLVWSPDGQAFVGTANGLGPYWNIGSLSASGGQIRAISETERYNCTPDWWPDSRQILYARGIIPEQKGHAQLWIAKADGQERRLVYAEEARHIYGSCASPDAKYLLFTRSVEDLGAVGKSQTTMAIIRVKDTPMIDNPAENLQQQYPDARKPLRLDLGPGWEPHWTYSSQPGKS
jgi:Tol biopolymer transport system component